MDLNTIWFILFGVLVAGYAVLDGFDLGVGVLHLFAKNDMERDAHTESIGPVWDGNEVWLLTAGGALFAAFPPVYATVFSGFYLALMLLLLALIMRAVSLEYRHALRDPRWVRSWDYAFGVGSLLPALLFGVAVGNILRGVPIAKDGTYLGTFLGLLNPYALLVGIVSLVFFVAHGALYLQLKTEGDLADRLGRWIPKLWATFVVLYVAATFASVLAAPTLFDGLLAKPTFWVFTVLLFGAIAGVPVAHRKGRRFLAFLASSVTIVSMIGVAATSMFPVLVPSITDPTASLTIYNASSSQRTLSAMLVIALIGMPIVLGYTVFVYRIFRGKVGASHYTEVG
jgi:cytochrome d ubiquinol oxidase subunit II